MRYRWLWMALCATDAHAQSLERTGEDKSGIFSVVYENDVFAGTDQNYSNGVRFAWLSSEDVPDEAEWLAAHVLPIEESGKKRISLAAGQSMFTPRDLTRRDLIRDDRPYAGWLYVSGGMVSDTGSELDNIVLTLGVVGPASLAEQTQKFVHTTVTGEYPQGWNNQLKNEPGAVLTYEHKWRSIAEFSPFGLGVDFTPHVGVNLGNVFTDAAMGGTVRIGYDLPGDYGPPRIRPSLPGSDFFIPTRELGGYVFAGVEGRAVGRNIFLDGNTFRDSHSVDKKLLVGGLQAGVAVTYGQTRLSYTHVLLTKEFKTQKEDSQFGALTLSWRF
ncbi:MAG: lipid A deacylase LpxR family protein [Rickettsiales bacterium]|nr:lipid A deacylase LpxR family protein [Rickettsiales bacterium]